MCSTLSYSDLASVLVLLDEVYMHAHTLTYNDSTCACTCVSKQSVVIVVSKWLNTLTVIKILPYQYCEFT